MCQLWKLMDILLNNNQSSDENNSSLQHLYIYEYQLMTALKLDSIHQGRHPNYFRYVALIEHILQCTTALHREDLNTNLHWEMQERDDCTCCAKKNVQMQVQIYSLHLLYICLSWKQNSCSIGPPQVSIFWFLLIFSQWSEDRGCFMLCRL